MSKILCVGKSAFDEQFGRAFSKQGLLSDVTWDKFVALLAGSQWLERNDVETDEAILQIIPYVALINMSMDLEIMSYVRGKAGNEDRLHRKWSFGFGGHIDEEDCVTDDDGHTVLFAAARELKEELNVELAMTPDMFRGLIFTPEDAVGRVHLGAFFVGAWSQRVSPAAEVEEWGWREIQELEVRNLENWSKACMEFFRRGSYAYSLSPCETLRHVLSLRKKLAQLDSMAAALRPRVNNSVESLVDRLGEQLPSGVFSLDGNLYRIGKDSGIVEVPVHKLG